MKLTDRASRIARDFSSSVIGLSDKSEAKLADIIRRHDKPMVRAAKAAVRVLDEHSQYDGGEPSRETDCALALRKAFELDK